MINVFLGRAGRLWPEAVRLVQNARRDGARVLLLVPQQYTLQTERQLMDALGSGGFFDVDVLSPLRFTQRVFAQAGGDDRTRIDARGKAMAVAGALLKCRRSLKYYESAVERQGLIERVGTLIADFKRAGVSCDALSDYAQALPQGAARDKFSDLALIYAAYEKMLSGQFADGEDVDALLAGRVASAELMMGARMIVYGFDVLTGEMTRLLSEAARAADEMNVLLTGDPGDEAFSPVVESTRRFERELSLHGIPFKEIFRASALNAPQDICVLERSLLSSVFTPFEGPVGAVRLYAAPTPYAEAHFAAREILLLHDAGTPYSAMQVLCCDEGRYFSTLDAVFESYHIPHYLARKASAAQTGAAAFLISSLRAVSGGFRRDDVLAALRTGYLPLTDDERFRMENYIIAYGINGQRFLKPYSRGGDEGAALEEARARMMAPLARLRDGLREAADTDGALGAVVTLLNDADAYGRLTADAQALEEARLPAQAAQLRQVWKTLMELLDQMHDLMGGEKFSGATAALWLTAGLEQTELSALPPDADSVVCGLLGNVPLSRPDALFILGMNDGAFKVSEGGLMTEDEQKAAEKALDAYLSLDADGREKMSRLDVYKAFSSPKKTLYLSHAQALQDGTALRPHALLRAVRARIKALVEEGGVTAPQGASLPLAPVPALETLGTMLRSGEMADTWRGAWRYLSMHQTNDAKALLSAFVPGEAAAPLPRDVAHELFMERISSVSKLETYAVCPFKHFVQYGLKPAERAEWKIDPRTTGSFYHAALEGFTRLLPQMPAWPEVTREECNKMIDSAAEPALGELLTGVMNDSARARAAGERYKRLLRRVAWTFTLSARQSSFRPCSAEVRFGYDGGLPPVRLKLKDGSEALLRGIIDRIDRYQGDEGVYLRVIDYKSAAVKLSPQQVFYGVQLQLLMYLLAALQSEEGALAAGAFYFHLADPVLLDPKEKDDVETKLAQALSLSGVSIKDAEIIKLMDAGDPPVSLPGLLTKKGDFGKNKQLATLEQMRGLIEHARDAAARLSEEIASGAVAAAPLELEGEDPPCVTCDFKAICRKDALGGAVSARLEPKMTFDELLERVTKQR